MKIDMNLFCLIGALATGITDGRISSSSSTQRVGGSAMEVTPNRRELEPLQYCTAIDKKTGDGKQRGVVDWQNFDQCKKCEGGQPWWPCDGNLCIGFCTPEDVCDERLRVAAAAAATTASDCAEKEVKIAKVFERTDTNINEMEALISDQAVREISLKDKKITDLEKVIKSLEEKMDAIIAKNDEFEEAMKSVFVEKYCAEEQLLSSVEAAADYKHLSELEETDLKSCVKNLYLTARSVNAENAREQLQLAAKAATAKAATATATAKRAAAPAAEKKALVSDQAEEKAQQESEEKEEQVEEDEETETATELAEKPDPQRLL